ncbi:MAG: phospholipid carrier-dependent glycosyltransferase [Polaribacter sp.]|jgi:hypothetical protein|nr:phospholipid carrier-dependent glycosyltransferase [Polaribacter sp.]
MKLFKKPLFLLYFVLLAKALICFFIVESNYIPLNPDEAQYWTWSQVLDYGYYSKPPGIAWQIATGCLFFGNTELGIRFFSIVFSLFTALIIYKLSYLLTKSKGKASFSTICFALSPLAVMGSLVANTDVAMAFFLALALYFSCLFLEEKSSAYKISFAIALGSLFKWTIFLLWPVLLALVLFYKRHLLKSCFKAIILSFAGLLPSLIWNVEHQFSTFKHVYTQSSGGMNQSDGNFFEFLISQSALVGPVFFILLFMGAYWGVKAFKEKSISFKLLFVFVHTYLLFYLIMSLFTKMQPNWAIFIYPVYFSFFTIDLYKKVKCSDRVLLLANACSLLLISLALSIPALQQNSQFANYFPYKINPFRHHVGWQELPDVLKEEGYDASEHFLFSHKYQITSLLSFYSPEKKRAYFFNLGGSRLNQFVFWKQMSEMEKSKDGFFLFVENEPKFSKGIEQRSDYWIDNLKTYFREVKLVRKGSLYEVNGKLAKGYLLYKGLEYNGKNPERKKIFW